MLKNVNNFLWIIATFLIFISGIFLSFKIKFSQFNFKRMFGVLKENDNTDGISTIQTLTLNLAAKIGVGSITGIALAIYLGGPGTIFWMWISALVASSNTFIESVLAVLYNEKDEGNIYKGGPYSYIEKGIGNKLLAKLYSFLILITFIGGFLTIQSNTITVGLIDYFNVSPLIVGIVIAILVGIMIIKGVKIIARVTNFLVPFMALLYFILCFLIMIINIDKIPSIISEFFISAFSVKSVGIGTFSTFIIGMQRGIFSHEAGIGTGAISAAVVDRKNFKSQGYIQTLGIYIDALIVGTLSAIVIMCCDYGNIHLVDANGIEIAKYAFSYHLGNFGNIMLLIIIILFAFSSIIAGYYYGESSIKYIKKNINKSELLIFKLVALILLVIGSISSSRVLWNFVDIFIAILAIINIYSLWKLVNIISKNNYF